MARTVRAQCGGGDAWAKASANTHVSARRVGRQLQLHGALKRLKANLARPWTRAPRARLGVVSRHGASVNSELDGEDEIRKKCALMKKAHRDSTFHIKET